MTYTIRQGDIDKFTIDPQTGVVRTRKFLDYERQVQYILIVGTVENTDLNDPHSTTTLVVNVLVSFSDFHKLERLIDLLKTTGSKRRGAGLQFSAPAGASAEHGAHRPGDQHRHGVGRRRHSAQQPGDRLGVSTTKRLLMQFVLDSLRAPRRGG